MPVITLCNGKKKKYIKEVSVQRIFSDIYVKELPFLIAGVVNNVIVNINYIVSQDSEIDFIYKKNDKRFLKVLQNSCIQLLQYSLKLIYPDIKFVHSCVLEDKFYCDFDLCKKISSIDLCKISEKMKYLVQKKYFIFNKKITILEFISYLKKNNENYIIQDVKDKFFNFLDFIELYFHEEYISYQSGVQAPNIYFCRYFKLLSISGAYFKNNKKNKMLQRIYGIVFSTQNKLLNFESNLENIDSRDHRKIAQKFDLYHIDKNSPGMIFWHHNGYCIFIQLKNYIRRILQKHKYLEVKTPILLDKNLWKKSGHWKNYQESMFTLISEDYEYCVKPMNCPGHVEIFKIGLKSYKDLPIRFSEFGSCHRKESSGSLHGLMRLRNFTQDDAHIFCTAEQVKKELQKCMELVLEIYKSFGFKKIFVNFSTRPDKRIGSEELWDKAEEDLENILIEKEIPFKYKKGEGAFYGPKIEISLRDSLNRIWQCGTVQLDFYLSKRLNAYYIDNFSNKKNPIIIHRAILGSIERFLGILIEEYNGNFPIWLSPIQVVILSINEKHHNMVFSIYKKLIDYDIRVIYDITKCNMKLKIRKYSIQRIPYILIIGDKELHNNTVTIRSRKNSVLLERSVEYFLKKIFKEIKNVKSMFNMEG